MSIVRVNVPACNSQCQKPICFFKMERFTYIQVNSQKHWKTERRAKRFRDKFTGQTLICTKILMLKIPCLLLRCWLQNSIKLRITHTKLSYQKLEEQPGKLLLKSISFRAQCRYHFPVLMHQR